MYDLLMDDRVSRDKNMHGVDVTLCKQLLEKNAVA